MDIKTSVEIYKVGDDEKWLPSLPFLIFRAQAPEVQIPIALPRMIIFSLLFVFKIRLYSRLKFGTHISPSDTY